jgi:hypothetical protein
MTRTPFDKLRVNGGLQCLVPLLLQRSIMKVDILNSREGNVLRRRYGAEMEKNKSVFFLTRIYNLKVHQDNELFLGVTL